MEQLTLDKAATNYSLDCFVNNPEISVKEAFGAGAEWQKEQLLPHLKQIAMWAGNISDERLSRATGPNDAALRGSLIVAMRQFAIDAIKLVEPEYKFIK